MAIRSLLEKMEKVTPAKGSDDYSATVMTSNGSPTVTGRPGLQ